MINMHSLINFSILKEIAEILGEKLLNSRAVQLMSRKRNTWEKENNNQSFKKQFVPLEKWLIHSSPIPFSACW